MGHRIELPLKITIRLEVTDSPKMQTSIYCFNMTLDHWFAQNMNSTSKEKKVIISQEEKEDINNSKLYYNCPKLMQLKIKLTNMSEI